MEYDKEFEEWYKTAIVGRETWKDDAHEEMHDAWQAARKDYCRTYVDHGMTLRDYFAGQAITGLASLSDNPNSPPISGQAVLAYKLADALIDAREEKQLGCTWTQDTDGIWKTSCGQAQEFTTGTREENGYKFCPYCGKEIQ